MSKDEVHILSQGISDERSKVAVRQLERLLQSALNRVSVLETNVTDVQSGVGAVNSVTGSGVISASPTTGDVIVSLGMIPESQVINLVTDLADINTSITNINTTLGTLTPMSRMLNTTAPLLIDGGASADLSADRTLSISADGIDNTLLRDSTGLSVIGRAANSVGDPADIVAGSDGDVLRRSGTTLGFGTIPSTSVTGLITGTGTAGRSTRWTGALTIADGAFTDDGTNATINGGLAVILPSGSAALIVGTSAKHYTWYPAGTDLRLHEYNTTQGSGGNDRITVAEGGHVTFANDVSVKGNATLGDSTSDAHTINGTINANSTAGTSGQILQINGSSHPVWAAPSSASIPTGTGTANKLVKWTGASTQGDSSFVDNGLGVTYTTSRQFQLAPGAATQTQLDWLQSGQTQWSLYQGANQSWFRIWNEVSGDTLLFDNDGSAEFKGNVAVGTAPSTVKLDVRNASTADLGLFYHSGGNGTATTSNNLVEIRSDDTTTAYNLLMVDVANVDAKKLRFTSTGLLHNGGDFQNDGNATLGTSTSNAHVINGTTDAAWTYTLNDPDAAITAVTATDVISELRGELAVVWEDVQFPEGGGDPQYTITPIGVYGKAPPAGLTGNSMGQSVPPVVLPWAGYFDGNVSVQETLQVLSGAFVTGDSSIDGELDLSNNKIVNLTNGSAAQDAAAFGQIGSAVNAAVTGTTNKVAKFVGTNSVGDSTITDDGTNVSLTGELHAGGHLYGLDLALNGNELHFEDDLNSYTTGYINYFGFNFGNTQFRDLIIANGKGAAIATFFGSTKALTVESDIQTNGNLIVNKGAGVQPILSLQQAGQDTWQLYEPGSSNNAALWNSNSGDIIQFSRTGVTVPGTLAVNGNATFLGNLATNGNLQVDGTATVNGDFTTGGDSFLGATSSDNTTVKGQLAVNGGTTLGDTSGDTTTVNGTLSLANVPGTGSILYNGTTRARLLIGVQKFTASGTYTPTSGTKAVRVREVGGGGGGGGAGGGAGRAAGGGGSSGAYLEIWIAPGADVTGGAVTIGAAGAAGTNAPTAGGNGGDTSVVIQGITYTAKGGTGGGAMTSTTSGNNTISVAPQAGSSTGDVNSGSAGGYGFASSVWVIGGLGGSSPFGVGGIHPASATAAGNGGTGFGVGGSGGHAAGAGFAGGAGTAGYVIIEEYA